MTHNYRDDSNVRVHRDRIEKVEDVAPAIERRWKRILAKVACGFFGLVYALAALFWLVTLQWKRERRYARLALDELNMVRYDGEVEP
jgi:hypothetical protein